MNILNWFIYERGPVASKSNNIKKWQQQTFFVICPQTFQSYIMYLKKKNSFRREGDISSDCKHNWNNTSKI